MRTLARLRRCLLAITVLLAAGAGAVRAEDVSGPDKDALAEVLEAVPALGSENPTPDGNVVPVPQSDMMDPEVPGAPPPANEDGPSNMSDGYD